MKVLVDTTVWSLALRRRTVDTPEADILATLLREDRAMLLGVVRQELLSGVGDVDRFRRLRDMLRQWPDYAITMEHFEVAAEACNACRAKGVQGSQTDFLICAVSQLDRIPIFTIDRDFELFAAHIPITLYAANSDS